MPHLNVTRLRLRSRRFMPAFILHTPRSELQVRAAPGFLGGAVLADRRLAFWTMTAWESGDAKERYMTAGAHRSAMRRLPGWCDEASVAHWDLAGTALPSWAEAGERMHLEGRASKVRHPSADHAALTYRAPRLSGARPVRPAASRRRAPG